VELAMRARIADGVDGESDVGSRRIDPPIRRRGGKRRDLRKETERHNGAGDSEAPNSSFASDHDLLTVLE
jgi:hypothetical protein